jgi:hypothetical protein
MGLGFVVMQIGNDVLDRVYDEAIAPALVDVGLAPRRVDRHNEGGLLKNEIVHFLEDADLIVADLSNERPNVYLEIGYAMGLDKFQQLVLTVREDHFPDSPNHISGGPRVHFDLAGYDILRWAPDAIPQFREELTRRLRRRLALSPGQQQPPAAPTILDSEWISRQRDAARALMARTGMKGHMELVAAVHPPKPAKSRRDLLEAASQAPIQTFGWPIAAFMQREDAAPKPRADGISAVIEAGGTSDCWAIRLNADLYFAGSLFEDTRREDSLFFDTRTNRVTESLMYVLRLYGLLGIPRDQRVAVRISHFGLRGRSLVAASRDRAQHFRAVSVEDESSVTIEDTLDGLEAHLPDHVRSVVEPMFELFNFRRFEPAMLNDIVNHFVEGRVR